MALISMRQLLDHAAEHNYGVPAFNVNNLEQMRAIMLAANQGMIFVLAVIVIGGFVGSGGLGYLVIMGSSKPELAGKGLVAGLAILILGVTIDRIAQTASRRI